MSENTHLTRLLGLHSSEYEHPLDRKFLDTLQSTPLLPRLTKKYIELQAEKIARLEFKGSYLQVTKGNLPKLYGMFLEACKVLDFYYIPELYIKQEPRINAAATGVEKYYGF